MSYTIINKQKVDKKHVNLTLREDATGMIQDDFVVKEVKKSVYSILTNNGNIERVEIDEDDSHFLDHCRDLNYQASLHTVGFKLHIEGDGKYSITGPTCGDDYAWTMLWGHVREEYIINPQSASNNTKVYLDSKLLTKIQNGGLSFKSYFDDNSPIFEGVAKKSMRYIALNNFCNLMRAHVYVIDSHKFVSRVLEDLKVSGFDVKDNDLVKLYKLYDYCTDYEDFKRNPYEALSLNDNLSVGEDQDDYFFKMIDVCARCYNVPLKGRFDGNMWWFLMRAQSRGDTCAKRIKWSDKKKCFLDIIGQLEEQTVHEDIKAIQNVDEYLMDIKVGKYEVIRCKMPIYKQGGYQKGEVFCFKHVLKQETAVGKKLMEIKKSKLASSMFKKEVVSELIGEYEKKVGMCLSDEQREAVFKSLCETNVSGIGGGPGNGKSLDIKAIKHICTRLDVPFIVIAPTGKAANKIDGLTVHKLYYSALYEISQGDNKEDKSINHIDRRTRKFKYKQTNKQKFKVRQNVV